LTYTWSPAAPILEGANTGTPTVAVNDMQVFTYTVENQFGCEQSGTVMVISASTRPPGTITQSLNCQGTTVDFRSEGSASQYFIWDFGDGNTSTEPNPSHEYDSPGEYDVTLQLDPRFPCAEGLGVLSSSRVNIAEEVITETSFTTNYDPCTDEGVVNFINTAQQMVEVLRIPTVLDSIVACANIPTPLNPNAIQDDTKYSWTPAGLLDDSNSANPLVTSR